MNAKLMNLENHNLPSEMSLLLLCSENKLSEAQQNKAHELTLGDFDWNYFSKLTIKHRIYPTVYRNLKKMNPQDSKSQILSELEQRCKKNQLNALQLLSELIRIMEVFEKSRIRGLSIKGPLLGLALYGDVSMRTSKDLDILVSLADIEKAGELLQEQGYTEDGYTVFLTPKQRQLFFKTSHHISYTNKAGIMIELHWRYNAGNYEIPFEEIWKNRKICDVSGKKINVLKEEENFLYLIFHGSKHAWKRLRWLCDINEILKKNELDWDYLIYRADKMGITYMLEQTLILVKGLFETAVSEFFISDSVGKKTGNAGITKQLAIMCMPFILSLDETSEFPGHDLYVANKKYMFVWNKGLYKKTNYIAKHFYPSAMEFQTYKIKDEYFFLYYVIRPFSKLKRLIQSQR